MATRAEPTTPRKGIPHPSVEERQARGQAARDRTPLSSHAGWAPASDRPDPVGLLQEQDRSREPDLVPVRHGRMLVSPFTFYRGAAKIMAADLAGTPTAGLHVQLCGDAHLSNFGAFASPERLLLFDVNDFDETLPGPFEYDVKRMATSFTIAGRNNGFSKGDARAAALEAAKAYREAMAGFAAMGTMEVWYARLDEDQLLKAMRRATAKAPKKQAKVARRRRRPYARRPRRLAPATACRRCPSSVSWSTALPDRQPAADRHPGPRPRSHLRSVPRPDRRRAPGAVPRLPGQPRR